MERLNSNEDSRCRSMPEGEIASEKLAVNLATLKELEVVRCAIESKDLLTDPLSTLSTLNENDKSLANYAIWRNANNRSFWSTYYLDKESSSLGLVSGSGYFEQQLMSLLGDFYGWNQPRIKWLLREMSEGVADDFKRVLVSSTTDKTAQKVARVLNVRNLEEMKPIVDAILDNVVKDRADSSFDPQDYFDPQEYFENRSWGSPLIEDFGRFVEIMKASLVDNTAADKILETV